MCVFQKSARFCDMPVPNKPASLIQPSPTALDLDFLFQTMNSKPIDASVDEKTSLLSSNPSDSSANVYSAPSEDSNPGALLTAPLLRSGGTHSIFDVID